MPSVFWSHPSTTFFYFQKSIKLFILSVRDVSWDKPLQVISLMTGVSGTTSAVCLVWPTQIFLTNWLKYFQVCPVSSKAVSFGFIIIVGYERNCQRHVAGPKQASVTETHWGVKTVLIIIQLVSKLIICWIYNDYNSNQALISVRRLVMTFYGKLDQ